MKIKVVEVSSGFGNVPNNIILAEAYGSLGERPGSAYDRFYTIELPDDFTIGENIVGEKMIFRGSNHVELASVNHGKRWVTGVSIDGFHHFMICED
jgi:hypothetical protein